MWVEKLLSYLFIIAVILGAGALFGGCLTALQMGQGDRVVVKPVSFNIGN